ncbi:hypothetical protein CU098_007251 [Rhizopus stolonifer]|uniref:Uncharacterized protein n=1 Tax=Rhizopus stolonifer TaxID=4846 RepID=A0A367J0Y6_RHIST|nr:hypothetical protein CU098_007251 [Rhizopus stolonifer]
MSDKPYSVHIQNIDGYHWDAIKFKQSHNNFSMVYPLYLNTEECDLSIQQNECIRLSSVAIDRSYAIPVFVSKLAASKDDDLFAKLR